jgi:hypothetical protein
MLTEAVKELEAELNKLTPPLAKDISNPSLIKNIAKIKKTKPKQKNIDIHEGMANLDDVDVTYEKND